MDNPKTRPNGKYVKYAIIVLCIIMVFLCAALFLEYRRLSRTGIRLSHQLQLAAIRNRGPLTIGDVNLVQSWMTFDYINKIFNLPTDYLKTALNISDTHYPRLPLLRYARNTGVDANVFTDRVKNAIHDYLANRK